MAAILGRFVKQPAEVLDYDVDYTDWFSNRADAPSAAAVSVPTGITLVSSILVGRTVKVTLSGGVAGERYKVTVLLTTTAGMVKEADFIVSVKDV